MGVGKSTFAFSNSSIAIDGGSTTIGITRDNQSYSHKLLHGYGDIATLAVGTTSYTYKPAASALTKFFLEVPAQKSRLIDIYLDTYNGSTKVGRDVHALTVTLSEATGKPSISGFAITDSNSTTNGWGVIVDGKSTLTVSATPTAKYGATISKNVFTCTYNSKTYESYYINDLIASLPLTTTPKSFTIGYKSTDSRGFSTTSTLSKTVAKYQAPAIETFEVIRCDTSGNESDTGTKAKVIIKGSWAAMKVGTAYKNPATLKVGYKTKAATSYTYQTISVSAGIVNVSQLLSATLTSGTDYQFSIQLADTFETYSETGVGCSNVKNILYVSADGEELVIGSDTGSNVAIDSDSVDIRNGSTVLATFTKDSIELGKDSASSTISLCDDKGIISLGNPKYLSEASDSLVISSEDIALQGASTSSIGSSTVQSTGDSSGLQAWSCVETYTFNSSGSAQSAVSIRACNGAMDSDGTYSGGTMGMIEVTNDGVNVYGGLTEDIPVCNSGNCNSLTTTGKYCIGSSGSNRPASLNGWLESKKYSTNYCYQTYVTYTGLKYERLMSAGIWGSWTRIYGEQVLFNNPSQAFSGAITLTDTAANYVMLDILYRSTDGYYGSTKVYSPNGKIVSLSVSNAWSTGAGTKVKDVLINAKMIDTYKLDDIYTGGEFGYRSNGAYGSYPNVDKIAITQVIGWK